LNDSRLYIIYEEQLTADQRRCTQIRRLEVVQLARKMLGEKDSGVAFQSAFICVHLRFNMNSPGLCCAPEALRWRVAAKLGFINLSSLVAHRDSILMRRYRRAPPPARAAMAGAVRTGPRDTDERTEPKLVTGALRISMGGL